MERLNQFFKDITERIDDYYPCMQNGYIINTTHSLSSPSNLSEQDIGNNGNNYVSIRLGNGDGTFY